MLGEIQTGTEISTTLESVAVATTLAVPLGLVSEPIADLGFGLGVDAAARIARRNGSLARY